MAKIKRYALDPAALRAELDEFERTYGVPSESRHEPFMREYRRDPFSDETVVFDETEDWRRWDRTYAMWISTIGSPIAERRRDPAVGDEPRAVRPVDRLRRRLRREPRWGTAGA